MATSRCAECAAELPPEARFCAQCGARVASGAARSPPTLASAGERRPVAILFADLSGYTRLSKSLDPEETHRLLTRFFEITDAIVERTGGSVDKHIGDAVMAVFGAPVAHGNDVERALRAAAAIHEAMAALSAEVDRPLRTHIGIASGEVVAAATGSAVHRSYTVTGDAVNLASRLTELARTGETVVSEDVQRDAARVADLEPLAAAPVRGLGDEVRAYRLIGLRSSARAPEPLVGRDGERGRFKALLARLRSAGTGAVVLLRADPGIGKSRLAEVFAEDARACAVTGHVATVLDFGAEQGRDAVYALVCAMLAVPPAAPLQTRRAALERAIAEGDVDAADEPYLADLLLLPQKPGSLYEAMDNPARRGGKLRALAAAVERAAHARPRLFVVEDVHWASDWVLTCLRAVAAIPARAPAILLLTTRRDGDPVTGAWDDVGVVRFDLGPLERADALALARAHLAASPDLASRCVERAQGNPLFLMQLLRSGSDEEGVPPTIQSVVLARLDRLPAADKAALQAAAVVGQRFPLALLRDLVGDPAYVPDGPLARDLVRVDAADRDVMMFTHALIRDGAYASLLHVARRELHRRAAEWYATRDLALRAEHLERADDARAAAAYLAAARGEAHAMRVEAALALALRAERLPADADTRFALASLEGELQAELGRGVMSIAAFERARDAAVGDAARSAAWIGIASGCRMTSDVAAGLAALDAAESHAAAAGHAGALAHIAYLRGSLHFATGDADACRQHHQRALELAQSVDDVGCEARALSGLADALYSQGRYRSAHAAFVRCLDICERHGFTRFSLMNRCMVAIIEAYFGRIDAALATIDRTRALARDVQYRLAETMCDESAAWFLVLAGRYDAAGALLARGLALARGVGARRFEIILEVSAANVAWHRGRADEARGLLADAWKQSEEVARHFAGPLVLGALAKCAQSGEARRRALDDGEKLLREPCVSHCYFGFYQWAIDATLAAGEWSDATRYADLLEDYSRSEPLPLIDWFVARGRALADAGRGRLDRDALSTCRQRAAEWKLDVYLRELDTLLAGAT
ncbi:MAG: adenylate/guanylate cyclase domain-containing protein [Rudaea sp.]